jgi:capsular polysaccharide biosynthesis protein
MDQVTQTQQTYDEIDLMDIIRILKRSWKLITVIFLLTVIVVGSITYYFIPKKYLSYTIFGLEAGRPSPNLKEGDLFATTFEKVAKVKEIVQTNSFLGNALEQTSSTVSPEKFEKLWNAISISETGAKNIKIQVIWDDPQEAQEILELIYAQYKNEVGKRIATYTDHKLQVAQEQFARNKRVFDQANTALANFQTKHLIFFLPPQMVISGASREFPRNLKHL